MSMRIKIIGGPCHEWKPPLQEGDEVTVDKDLGTEIVENGWAEDLDGKVTAKIRQSETLEIQNAQISTKGGAK